MRANRQTFAHTRGGINGSSAREGGPDQLNDFPCIEHGDGQHDDCDEDTWDAYGNKPNATTACVHGASQTGGLYIPSAKGKGTRYDNFASQSLSIGARQIVALLMRSQVVNG